MTKYDKEENLYNEDIVEQAISDDEISAEEEAFMQGYNDALEPSEDYDEDD